MSMRTVSRRFIENTTLMRYIPPSLMSDVVRASGTRQVSAKAEPS
jgi:hypothetical protein